MAIVKVENKTYTVDPLYQWDKNQALEIRGLSLAKVPEVHFTNTLMDRAVVRPASMNAAGVITTQVPNSLLQKASRITVYICTYEGSTFRTLYKLEIPVKARPMPGDYTFEDDAGEIYSFNALETKVNNAAAAYDQAVAKMTQASATYVQAENKYNEAAADMEAAEALQQDAQDKYTAALETLNGVQDGTVFLKKAGGNMAGPLGMGGNKITDLADPEAETDAVNKGYVDASNLEVAILWENATPSGSFSEQTITVNADLREYLTFYAGFKQYGSELTFVDIPVFPDNQRKAEVLGLYHNPWETAYHIASRTITPNIEASSFDISDVTGFTVNSTGSVGVIPADSKNTMAVPVVVYGVKKKGAIV